jgi:cellulose synthase/poly-beta-1,6-N-acetylglucosamine synthase-like glycosyltransferase
VYSDGSTDNTVLNAQKFKKNGVEVIDVKSRKGAALAQNYLLKTSNSEILVLLNADIMLTDNRFIEKLIQLIKDRKADLTCSAISEIKPKTFTESVIHISMKLKNAIFEKYHNGNNIYTCHGTARAFSKRLYSQMKFTQSIGEDAYSYLYCKTNGFTYAFVKSTRLYYRAPSTYTDHQKQALRFFESKVQMGKIFGGQTIEREYHVPVVWLLGVTSVFFFLYPVHMSYYILMTLLIRIKSMTRPSIHQTWDIATSSKKLR